MDGDIAHIEVYQLRVALLEISPAIWRRVLVRWDSTIANLHYMVQLAMGWSDTHLKRFSIHGKDHGVDHIGGMSFPMTHGRYARPIFSFASKSGSCTRMTSAP